MFGIIRNARICKVIFKHFVGVLVKTFFFTTRNCPIEAFLKHTYILKNMKYIYPKRLEDRGQCHSGHVR